MNVRFVVRGVLLGALAAIALLALGLFALYWRLNPPPGPTPPPPTILAPRGEIPAGPVGLQEWARYHGDDYRPVGSGFLLRLDDGEVVGVTTAHSVSLGDPDHPLERIALGVAGRSGFVAEFDTLHGRPGRPRTGDDFSVDYLLLQSAGPPDPGLVLTPDPRGAPQPGERVWLFSGLGGGNGARRVLEGTVQSVSERAVWVVMDKFVNPGSMSGSPFLSQHTGQVVGMAIAASPRGNRLLLGAHPIGSIVQLAVEVEEFPKIVEYVKEVSLPRPLVKPVAVRTKRLLQPHLVY